MWKRIKENAAAAGAVATIFVGFAAIAQFGIVNPIQQRFDAIDERFDAMDQRFDATDQRIDDFKAEITQRFDDQDKYINQRFDDQNRRIDDQNRRIDDQNQRIDDLRTEMSRRFDAVEKHLGRLSGEVSDLRKLADRVSRNEGRLDAITQQLQAIDAPAP